MRDELCPTTSHAWVALFFDAMAMGDDDCDSVNGNPDEVDNITLGMRAGSVFARCYDFFKTFLLVKSSIYSIPGSLYLFSSKAHCLSLHHQQLSQRLFGVSVQVWLISIMKSRSCSIAIATVKSFV